MVKKYKHIKLPANFINDGQAYKKTAGRMPILDLEINYEQQKGKVSDGIKLVKERIIEKQSYAALPRDRDKGELKIKFYGFPNKAMLKKYNIDIYEYQTGQKAVIGSISTKKIPGQESSDFERFEIDIENYRAEGALHSYFDKIENIKPLTFEEILEKDLKDFYDKNPQEKRMIDISFSSFSNDLIDEKMAILSKRFENEFISKVNTGLVHFCRISSNFADIKEVVDQFGEIIHISTAPFYCFESSGLNPIKDDVVVQKPAEGSNPIFVVDSPCNSDHMVIKDALLQCKNLTDGPNFHSTAVTSLAICGAELSPSGNIIQKNNAIAVEADCQRLEETIRNLVLEYHTKYPLLLINLSMNDYYNQFYDSTRKSHLTVLLDELSSTYNCLFFVSVGNLFCKESWTPEIEEVCIARGYPEYFNLPCTCVLPPSDSINNISVGSITYQASPRSLASAGAPSPITRKNINDNIFIKPDLVHYDGNVILNSAGKIESEGNGIYLAEASDEKSLTRSCGTSFATPLVTHEAGILHNLYPEHNNNSIKAMLIHFANGTSNEEIDYELGKRLTGFGKLNLERAMHSINHSSTVLVEDFIGMNETKRIKIPIPSCLFGSSKKRLKIRKTLVYNPIVFPKDQANYNPIRISACIHQGDDNALEGFSTRDRQSSAHMKSNVKKYKPIERSTNNEQIGKFWDIELRCDCRCEDYDIAEDHQQSYSLLVTIEDINKDESIDLHQEISQMVDIEIPIEVEV